MNVKNHLATMALSMVFSLGALGGAQAAVSYAPPTAVPAQYSPEYIAKGDLNGDGNIDVVSVNDIAGATPPPGSVTVLLSNGDGTFSTANYPVGVKPRQVAIGDLNGDGDNDLVVTNSGDGTITVLLNNGAPDFTFTAASIDISAYAGLEACEPSAVVIAHFDADAIPDLAVSCDIPGDANINDKVQILHGHDAGGGLGDGSFSQGVTLTVGDKPISMAAGDVNDDGRDDLLVGNYATSGWVSVLLGNGDGTFSEAPESPFGAWANPFSVVIGTIDGDLCPDIALVNYAQIRTVRVFTGACDGTFDFMFSAPMAGRPHSVKIDDLNGDGFADLLVASDNTGAPDTSPAAAVTVLLGDGSGGFPTIAQYPLSDSPNCVVSANLDNPGNVDPNNRLDLAVANGAGRIDILLSVATDNPPLASDGFLQVASADVPTMNVQSGTLVGTDGDGALLSYAVASQGTNGTVVITDVAAGTYTYTPSAGNFVPDEFTFTVDDGTGPSAAGTIRVVRNDFAPTITSAAAVTVSENQTAVITVTATDADVPAQTLSYSISGGADAARFSINSGTGVLRFVTAPNFETPTDANADNIYMVEVQVSDGAGGIAVQDIAVTVADVNEAPVLTRNGGGGGCSLGANPRQAGFDPVLPLLIVTSLLYLRRQRMRCVA